ncbi:MAG: NAD(P)H-dependent oxidoreductase [Proteobacteria bacterium]|nr:NAD(P)H-dependent oxidoreductase [Pseudomonadota bacterium]
MTVAVILASARSAGNTRTLVDMCFAAGVSIEDLARLHVAGYAYDDRHAEDDFLPLIRRLLAADVWLLATPLYWYTVSAQAKAFIDRLTDLITVAKPLGRQLRGRALGVLCTGTDSAPPPLSMSRCA